MFIMSRDGFSLLAMGFTGKEALQFKLDYIDAFNSMEKTIQNGNNVVLELKRHFEERLELQEKRISLLEKNAMNQSQSKPKHEFAPCISDRGKIRNLVFMYRNNNKCCLRDSWNSLYLTFCSLIGAPLSSLDKKHGETYIDVIERKGMMDVLLKAAMQVNDLEG